MAILSTNQISEISRLILIWIIIYKQQFLHLDWLKTCQLIPNQWNFTSATLNHIQFVFFTTIYKITAEIFVKICWQSENTDSDLTARPLHYTNELLVHVRQRQTFLSKTSANSLNKQKQYEIMFGNRIMTGTCFR